MKNKYTIKDGRNVSALVGNPHEQFPSVYNTLVGKGKNLELSAHWHFSHYEDGVLVWFDEIESAKESFYMRLDVKQLYAVESGQGNRLYIKKEDFDKRKGDFKVVRKPQNIEWKIAITKKV